MSPVRETLATKFWHLIAVICVVAIVPGDTLAEMPSFHAQSPSTSVQAKSPPAEVPPDQLDSLVAPIALYPDPLLAQTLAASTYPLEIIQLHDKWSFDAKAGEQELLYRRVGANELDAIQISHGFVEAQHAYALRSHKLYNVNQYAQRIISTPGQEDGLTCNLPTASGRAQSAKRLLAPSHRVTVPEKCPITATTSKPSKDKVPPPLSENSTTSSKAS